MSAWRDRLNEKKLLVLDGAWGTQLAERGLPTGEAPERWNLERPDDVRAIASAYANAGADIVLTNTFGGNRYKLEKSRLDAEIVAVNQRGVELSREGAAGMSLVFASVGPTGEFMAPLGTVSEVEMVHCFAEQLKALVAGGCDGIVVETMTDLNEAKAALRAAKANCGLPVAVSMTFDKRPSGYATMMGVRPAQAAEDLTAAGADIVGANCGSGVEDIVEITRLMHPATDALLWAKPNAGLPQLIGGRTVFSETPEVMVTKMPELVEAGIHHFGGCCGTTPDHVRMFRMCRDNLVHEVRTISRLRGIA
jgi:5-methyltetrahydrofolate--homocysteine methyltransferase